MKKKIVALMAVIPLILLFTVFSVSGAVSLAISIPVSSITIENKNNGIITLDNASYDDSLKLSVHVNPLNAANKGYIKTLELLDDAEGDANDVLSVSSDGRLTLGNKIGRVKLTYTSNDGGYSDSVILIATSSKVMSLSATATSLESTVPIEKMTSGDNFRMRADVYPLTAIDQDVVWSSSDESIVSVNSVTGFATALTSGVATLVATCSDGCNGTLTSSTTITVEQLTTLSQITVNGKNEHTISVLNKPQNITLYLEVPTNTELNTQTTSIDKISDIITNELGSGNTVSTKRLKLTVPVVSQDLEPNEQLTLTFSNGEFGTPYDLTIEFVEAISFVASTSTNEVANDSENYLELSRKKTFAIFASPAIDGLSYVWNSSNINAISLAPSQNGESCKLISSSEVGESILTVSAYLNGILYKTENDCDFISSFTVITKQSYTDFVLKENSSTWGIANQFSAGDKFVSDDSTDYTDADYDNYEYKFELSARNNLTVFETNQIDTTVLEWTSSDNSIATVIMRENQGHFLNIVSSGEVTLTVTWKDGIYFDKTISESITMYCVKDGVNVYDYFDLRSATEDGYKVVLMDDIMVGKNLTGLSSDKSLSELKSEVSSMPTTADDSYYMSIYGEHPTVNYCVEFKNDAFGNGYFLNANNITNYNDGSVCLSNSVFGGPLNMVDLVGIASVKAQDNIVYLVRTADVTLNNIEFMGCSDVSDLSTLNNVGTTLEVLSSGVNLINSRVKNGRTVLRYFGKAYDNNATADQLKQRELDILRIESCTLSCAREFILKIGTNATIKNNSEIYDWNTPESQNNYEAFAPKLTDADGITEFNPRENSNLDYAYFVDNYIKTQVILKNSVLATSGLFSIGMESKFAGPLLFGYKMIGIELEGWSGLAGTSFSSLLKLEGDVRLYDWKNLNNIDSSSLIEVENGISDNYAALSMFNLDIGQMVLDVSSQYEEYQQLLLTDGDTKYAHGGIAFYGGGYNYSIVDTSEFTGAELKSVSIDMETNETLSTLKIAAGNQPFHFLMYGNDSSFNLATQLSDFSNGTAYSWIPPCK
ncbi:MAG: Ig-like domain-containing protein [Clostridia bacterium]|nr:Ig-like domain-containing protein [Clostridia bacterium]